MRYKKAVVFYERPDKEPVDSRKIRLVFEDGSELVTKLREFKITDEDEKSPNPDADPMKVVAQWDQENATPPELIDLVGTQVACNEFWGHILHSEEDLH